MRSLKKAELAVAGATLLILCFTAGYFVGRSSGAHVITFESLPSSSDVVTGVNSNTAVVAVPSSNGVAMSSSNGVAMSSSNGVAMSSSNGVPAAGKLNINTATLPELDALPGIGAVLGQNIITYRQKTGGFKSIEQIMDVDGIGDKKYEAIKNLITIG